MSLVIIAHEARSPVFWATPTMNDDKRYLRRLKREIKRAGNKKLRQYLKNVDAEPDEFDFGRDNSAAMNEPRQHSDHESGRVGPE